MKAKFLIDGQKPQPDLIIVSAKICEGINQVSLLDLVMASPSKTAAEKFKPGGKATLKLSQDQKKYKRFDGLIYSFGSGGQGWPGTGLHPYRMLMRPAFWQLNQGFGSQVFSSTTVPKVIKKVLQDAGLASGSDFKLSLLNESAYPQEEQIVQYQESSLAFLTRLMRENGINFFFKADQSGNAQEQLVMADDRSFFSSAFSQAVSYAPQTGLMAKEPHVDFFEFSGRAIPKKVKVQTHQALSPHQTFSGDRKVDGGVSGEVHLFGRPGLDQAQAERMAKISSQELASAAWLGRGESNLVLFSSGEKFSISPDPTGSQGASYLLTEVEHCMSQDPRYAAGGEADLEYKNSFRVAKGDSDYRPGRLTPWLAPDDS